MELKITHLNPFGILLEPSKEYENIFDLELNQLYDFFRQHHLVVLRGFQTFHSAENFSEYCGLLGEVSIWPFGKVLELIEQKKPRDHIFDHNYVPLHWDGMYRPQVPKFQIFHCVSAPQVNQGGRTTFSNTAIALDRVSDKNRDFWAQVSGVYSREMEFYHSKTIAPIITKHPDWDYSVIRFCEPPKDDDETFINHPNFEFKGILKNQISDFLQDMRECLYAKENFYAHSWKKNDVVIADNYTLLHGREAFESGAPRHLRRVHVLGNPPLKNPHLVFHRERN